MTDHTDAPAPRILGTAPRAMRARDPEEHGRAASPLELLYDLTLVVAFGVAGSELAHALAAGHVLSGLAGFAFIQFGAVWAWVSYTWFAASYDTDDVWVRLAVIAQMVGVLLMALGTPRVFAGSEHGWQLDNAVVVAGYVVMRLSLIGLYVRALRANPDRRRPLVRSIVGTSRFSSSGSRQPSSTRSRSAGWWRASPCTQPNWCCRSGSIAPRVARRGTPTTSPNGSACWP